MLFASRKKTVCHCAQFAFVLAIAVAVALTACPSVEAQQPAAPADQGPNAAPATPEPGEPAPPTVKKAAAPEVKPKAPAKPPALRLNRDYNELAAPENEQQYVRTRSQIQRWLRAGAIPAGEEKTFVDYYNKYALARWTFVDRRDQVADFRRELRNDLTTAGKVNQGKNPAHDGLVNLVLNFMKGCTDPTVLAQPGRNFSATTRFNAIMMIGELNELEPASGGRNATPLPAALDVLLDRATDPKQIDIVRIGALIGIRRHCRLLPANAQLPGGISRIMVDLLRAKESERVRSPEGHAWMRLIAVQTFADLRGKPNTAAVANELLKVIAEMDSPDFLRYAAASALGSLDYRNAAGLDMNVLLQALGLLAIEVCDNERQRLRDQMESEKKPTRGGPGGYGPYAGGTEMGMDTGESYEDMIGGYGPGAMSAAPTNTKQDRQIERARRRLKEGMTAALIGMGKKYKVLRRNEQPSGVSAMARGVEKKEQDIEAFSNAIHDFFKVIDTKEDDKQIEAKPLDEAIAKVRQDLVDALDQIGAKAPESPEFEPLPDPEAVGPAGIGSGREAPY